uniref:EF-hand domain-containing protein n=1 Tax=Ciona savignyi TaxID=51511 RepID=H2Z5F9_CIOSA
MLRNRKAKVAENTKENESEVSPEESKYKDKPLKTPEIKNAVSGKTQDRMYSFITIFGVAIIVFGLAMQIYIYNVMQEKAKEKAIRTLGATGLKIFKEYDLDKDMKLDAAEFKHLYEYILSDHSNDLDISLQETDEVYDENTDEVLMLTAEMEPLVLSSMSQTNKNPAFGTPLFHYPPEFTGLVAWKKPRKPEIELFAKEFKIFLPPNSSQMIGDAYWVVEKPTNIEELTGNRYRSPLPKTKAEKLLHKLMSMFHSRPFVTMRFSPHGGA